MRKDSANLQILRIPSLHSLLPNFLGPAFSMAVFTHMLLGSNFHPLPFRHGFVGSSSSIQIPKYSSPKLSKLPSTHQSIGWQCPLPSTFCAKNSFGHWPSKMSYRSLSPIAGLLSYQLSIQTNGTLTFEDTQATSRATSGLWAAMPGAADPCT